jgi:hypothetical protein
MLTRSRLTIWKIPRILYIIARNLEVILNGFLFGHQSNTKLLVEISLPNGQVEVEHFTLIKPTYELPTLVDLQNLVCFIVPMETNFVNVS